MSKLCEMEEVSAAGFIILLSPSIADAIDPLMDSEPVDMQKLFTRDMSQQIKSLTALVKCGMTSVMIYSKENG